MMAMRRDALGCVRLASGAAGDAGHRRRGGGRALRVRRAGSCRQRGEGERALCSATGRALLLLKFALSEGAERGAVRAGPVPVCIPLKSNPRGGDGKFRARFRRSASKAERVGAE